MTGYVVSAILVMGAATVLCRAAPFLFLGRYADRPAVRHIGRGVPPIVLTLLVLYCLKGIDLRAVPYGLPEAIALAATIGLHLAWRNALISICAGTALYMVLVQTGVIASLL